MMPPPLLAPLTFLLQIRQPYIKTLSALGLCTRPAFKALQDHAVPLAATN